MSKVDDAFDDDDQRFIAIPDMVINWQPFGMIGWHEARGFSVSCSAKRQSYMKNEAILYEKRGEAIAK
jgi:hypothetical protein